MYDPAAIASALTTRLSWPWQRRRVATRPWGDGLVRRSAATAHYGRAWADVDIDELVWLDPTLAAGVRARSRSVLATHLAAILSSRARALGVWLLANRRSDATLLLSQILPPCFAQDIAAASGNPTPRCSPSGWTATAQNDEVVLYELGVLVTLTRLWTRASATAKAHVADADIETALIAAMHTRINTAYIYPAHEAACEVLAAGAWIGVLIGGRSAIVPDGMSQALETDCAGGDGCAALLAAHARLAGISSPSRLKAGNVVSPRRAPRDLRPPVWNAALAAALRLALRRGRYDMEDR